MTLPVWDPALPQCLEYGYSEDLPETTIRTQMEYGPDKVRRRTTVGVGRIRGSVLLTREQAATLATFYDTSIAGGALPFEWVHPRTGATTRFRLVEPPGIAQISPRRWRASLSLEILPEPTS